ncbi:sensor histidine kinase [Candidatus Allofournierella merdipullorum]|uniref:sensor histidine kinase n=1 Tax=Candidatus Allofournierella merdipullorum TaxID=2838595 RepID=UPI00374F00F6
MMRSLRLRLTGLYALLSALVLAAALVAGALWEARDLRQAGDESLLDAASAVAARLAGATTLADSWLTEQEQAYDCVYYLEDNGVPLEHTEKNGSKALLTDEALDRCAGLGAGQSAVFDFETANGEIWRCAAVALAPANLRHGPRLLLAFRSTALLNAQLAGVAVKYALLWVGGTALLTAAGALLAHIALKPTAAALRQQNEFVAAASHELRAPLTVIKSSLQATASEPARRDKLLTIAGAEVTRLQRLTEELLFLAGQDAHILRLCPEELEPDTFLLEVWEAWRAPLRQSGRDLTLELPDEPFSPIRGDKARLEQLFTILLHNAMEYTPTGTAIELAAERRGGGVCFSVRDHGPGVPEKDRQRIFRRFARGEECRTGKEHFGLGLSIARQIALLHGGKLWVEDASGGGAVFLLQLPAGH